MNLYKIVLRNHKICYAVAKDSAKAYKIAREHFNEWDYWFGQDREMHTIELLASTKQYNDCDSWVFLEDKP